MSHAADYPVLGRNTSLCRGHFPLVLMHVISECGDWERQDLDVDCHRVISREDAHELVPKAEVEFVQRNQVST